MCKVSVVDVYVTYVKFLARNDKVCLVVCVVPACMYVCTCEPLKFYPCSDSHTLCFSFILGQIDDVEAFLPTLPHLTAVEVARRMVAEGMVGSSRLSTRLGAIGARFLTSQDQQAVLEGEANHALCLLTAPSVDRITSLPVISSTYLYCILQWAWFGV